MGEALTDAFNAHDAYGEAPKPFDDGYPALLEYIKASALLSIADDLDSIRTMMEADRGITHV